MEVLQLVPTSCHIMFDISIGFEVVLVENDSEVVPFGFMSDLFDVRITEKNGQLG